MAFLDQAAPKPTTTSSNTSPTTPAKTPEQLVAELRNSASTFVNTQLSSVNNLFNKSKTSLASSISKGLTGLFGDTLVKSASSPTTQTSDPVSSLLKNPISSSFKLSSLQPGSTSVTGNGSVSQSGSLSNLMVGTQLSTLLNRFSLDTKDALNAALSTKTYQDKLTGLFGDLSVTVDGVNAANTASNNRITVDPKNPIFGTTDISLNITEALKDINQVQNLADPLGSVDTDIFSFYTKNTANALLNENGDIVSTSQTVSADSANSILNFIKQTGCTLTNGDYSSVFGLKSLFSLSTLAAASQGMIQELKDLVTCSRASTSWGQTALKDTVLTVANNDLQATSTILPEIKDTSSLEVANVDQMIFTNAELDQSDVSTVSSLLTNLNSSPAIVLEIPSVSGDGYSVWDAAILEATQPAFMSAILEATDMDNYINGTPLLLSPSGQFALA